MNVIEKERDRKKWRRYIAARNKKKNFSRHGVSHNKSDDCSQNNLKLASRPLLNWEYKKTAYEKTACLKRNWARLLVESQHYFHKDVSYPGLNHIPQTDQSSYKRLTVDEWFGFLCYSAETFRRYVQIKILLKYRNFKSRSLTPRIILRISFGVIIVHYDLQ